MRMLNRVKLQAYLLRSQEWFRAEKIVFQASVLVVVAGYLLSHVTAIYNALTLTPSSLFLFHIWRPLTACLVETNLPLVLWSIAAMHWFVHTIEPVWGIREVIIYSLVTQLVSTILISTFALAAFAMFHTLDFFYYAQLNGLLPLCAGALVAVKQFLPDSVVLTTTRGRLKNSHLPLTSLFVLFVLYLVGIVRGTAVLQTAIGIQISWTYLRFVQRQQLNHTVGDDSEHFAWHTLFPRVCQPACAVLGALVHRFLVKLKLLRRMESVLLPTLADQSTVELDADCEAERKRQIALRELQTRLMQQQQSGRAAVGQTAPFSQEQTLQELSATSKSNNEGDNTHDVVAQEPFIYKGVGALT